MVLGELVAAGRLFASLPRVQLFVHRLDSALQLCLPPLQNGPSASLMSLDLAAGAGSASQQQQQQQLDEQQQQQDSLAGPTHVLMGAPKKRTSHARKRWRATHKQIRNKTNIVTCEVCGNARLMHTLCSHCYAMTRRETSAIRNQLFAEEKAAATSGAAAAPAAAAPAPADSQ